jgi:flagellin
MAQVINTNVGALFAGAALNKSAIALQTAQERLSSGLRINSAKDDATGLVTAIGYDTQIRAANVGVRNALDAISTAQTKDGYLSIVTENLQRMAEIGAGAGIRCACP